MKHNRIAVISYYSCPLNDEKKGESGGRQIYTLEISKELAKKGYIIDIFTRTTNKNVPKIVNIIPNLRLIHLPAGEQKDIQRGELIKYIPEFLENFYEFLEQDSCHPELARLAAKRVSGSSEMLNQVQHDAGDLPYDLINCHYYLSGLIGLEIKKKLNIPFFITFHTLSLMKNLVARSSEEIEGVDRINAEFLLTKTADKVIATSKKDAQYINTLYNCPLERIEVVMPGIDVNIFKPTDKKNAKKIIKVDSDKKIILFVGRIVPLKGIDVLLYALKILVNKNPNLNICLWIVGEGPIELKRLNEIVKLLNLSKFVKFTGQKQQNELPVYYNAADIVIMPSLYESFGMSILEAMSCGTPVITTGTTGVSDLLVKEQNLVTSAINPIALAGKIKSLLTNEKEYEKVKLELLNKVQNLTWENAANTFIQILNKFTKQGVNRQSLLPIQ